MDENEFLLLDIETKFRSIGNLINENRCLNEIKFDSLVKQIICFNLDSIYQKLNDARIEFFKKLNKYQNKYNQRLVELEINESNLKNATGLYGLLFYKNDFTSRKKLNYLNFFNFYTEIDFSKFKQIDRELITVLVINLDRFFFQFKSKNSLIDFICITNKNCELLYESQLYFNHATFSKYLSNKRIIVSCHTDFEDTKHCLRVMDHQLMQRKKRFFDEILNLCLINDSEIICFRPCQYLLMNSNLEILRTFGQFMHIECPFYIQSNCILSAVSKDYFFFKLSDDFDKKIAIRIVDKLDGKLVNIIHVKASDRFKADYETNTLLVKSINEPKLIVYEPNEFNFVKIKVESRQFRKFYFLELNSNYLFYSVNFLNNKINLI